MTDNYREHACPNCGAPMGIPDKHDRFFKCSYCGTVLEDQASKEEQETGVFKIKISEKNLSEARISQIPTYSMQPAIKKETSNRLGCIIGAIVTALVLGILAVALVPALFTVVSSTSTSSGEGMEIILEEINPFTDSSGLQGLRVYAYSATKLLPSDTDTTPDFIGVARPEDEILRLIYVDFEGEPPLRWMVETDEEDAVNIYNQFLADDTRVFFNSGTKIFAYNRNQGSLIWENTLTDRIQHNICTGCFQLFGETIMTLSVDGTLEAWQAGIGESLWQVQLIEAPRQIVNFGGNPAVLDQIDEAIGLKIFDVTNGNVLNQLIPTCPSQPFPDRPQNVEIYDPMLVEKDGSAVYFFGGFFEPGCAQRWASGFNSETWKTTYPSDIAIHLKSENLLLTDTHILFGVRNGVYAVDKSDGRFIVLVEEEDYSFLPLAMRDDVLVVLAERTRGTRQQEIWGIDVALGNLKWSYQGQAEDYFDEIYRPLAEDGNWVVGLTPNGLTVAQLYAEPARLVLQTIALENGTASTPIEVTLPVDGGGNWTSVLGWRGDAFWVLSSASIYVIKAGTGEILHTWP